MSKSPENQRLIADAAKQAGDTIFAAMAQAETESVQLHGKRSDGAIGVLFAVVTTDQAAKELQQLLDAWATRQGMKTWERNLNQGRNYNVGVKEQRSGPLAQSSQIRILRGALKQLLAAVDDLDFSFSRGQENEKAFALEAARERATVALRRRRS